MRSVLLINPNVSTATTAMMLAAARRLLPPEIALRGMTATQGAAMIVDAGALALAALEVIRIGRAGGAGTDAVIVAAFGDPGVAALRAALTIPVIGIGEAALREAARDGRPFGIATTTAGLKDALAAMVRDVLPGASFTGVQVAEGDPIRLAADPERQAEALHRAVQACLERDGAATVVIGGGPLTDAATVLARALGPVIVEPVPAAMRALLRLTSEAEKRPEESGAPCGRD